MCMFFFFFQAEDGIRDLTVTGVQTCALPISGAHGVLIDSSGLSQKRDSPPLKPRSRDGCHWSLAPNTLRLKREVRSEERRVGKSVDLGGRRIIKKKKKRNKGE